MQRCAICLRPRHGLQQQDHAFTTVEELVERSAQRAAEINRRTEGLPLADRLGALRHGLASVIRLQPPEPDRGPSERIVC